MVRELQHGVAKLQVCNARSSRHRLLSVVFETKMAFVERDGPLKVGHVQRWNDFACPALSIAFPEKCRPVGQTKAPAPKSYLHFALSQSKPWKPWLLAPMAAILFACPNMGIPVQAWLAGDNRSDNAGETFEPIECIACRRFHYVNPATGRVLGARHK
jgi:hypothetical protein